MSSLKEAEFLFFFGAGASIATNVPRDFGFVNEFVTYINDSDDAKEQKCLDDITDILNKRNKSIKANTQVDINEVPASLVRLSDKKEGYCLATIYRPSFKCVQQPY